MVRKQLILFTLLVFQLSLFAQQGQVVKGKVVDIVSQSPLPGASVVILESNPQLGTITDGEGNFRLWNVKPGRYDILVSFVGYEHFLFREVLVGSGKEVVLNAGLKETTKQLDEVRVVARTSKERAINTMATISARQLSVEEASRYAGGYDDPARLASSFAGVASETGNNGIVIRGNSPRYMLWKMEGVEISNPTHFANVTAFGAGGITALSSLMLANSDFFTGAFPAEYGNALSGVFDVRMRTGNNETRETAFQIGGIGVDFSSEGPFKNGGKSSYLFNYRYSTLTLLSPLIPEEAGVIKYQDLAFKMNFPTGQIGTFTLWGIGALDVQNRDAIDNPEELEEESDLEKFKLNLSTGALGLTHKLILNPKTYLHTSLSASGNGIETNTQKLDEQIELQDKERIMNNTWKLSLSSSVSHKFGVRHSNETGFIINQHFFNVNNQEAPEIGQNLKEYEKDEGNTRSLQAFTQSNFRLGKKIEVNAGIHAHYFGLNKELSIEPRIGLKWQLAWNQLLGFAYGLNSRIEMIGFYLAQQDTDDGITQPNRDMKMTKSHHFGLAYDINLNENLRLKIEPYYQYLFDVPVISNSYFSLQNLELDWFFNETLVNDGTGTNIGIDFTLERFLKDGFYYLATASVFNSKYKGGDGIERNSLYNKNYILSLLGGKEWMVGKNRTDVLSINGRFTFMAGDRYTALLVDKSVAEGELIYDYQNAFEQQEDPASVLSFSISYRKNKAKHASIWSLHLLNALGHEEFRGYEFNVKTGDPEMKFDQIMVPNLSYRIEF